MKRASGAHDYTDSSALPQAPAEEAAAAAYITRAC